METRVERNKRYRKKKRYLFLFILITIILLTLSLYQINRSFHQMVGEPSHLLAFNNNEESIGITVLGKNMEITRNSIQHHINFFRETPQKISDGILHFLKKISNH